jgi:hypothetical protein
MSKYENYYPVKSCFKDKETYLKKDSICDYCYSCYLEICDIFSMIFQLEEGINDIDKIQDKIMIKIEEKSNYYTNRLEESVEYIVNILNKYTNYSKVEKKGYNLLHISFIEKLIIRIGPMLNIHYSNEENKVNYKHSDQKLKSFILYKLNIICFEVYCNYHYKTYRIPNSIIQLYALKSIEKIIDNYISNKIDP